jgi:hypothetical protein
LIAYFPNEPRRDVTVQDPPLAARNLCRGEARIVD